MRIEIFVNGSLLFTADRSVCLAVPSTLFVETVDTDGDSNVVRVCYKTAATSANLTSAEKICVETGRMIPAIKSVRERTGLGLKEAKQLCDKHKEQIRPADADQF